ncbi:hypothetical protein DPMN_009309 [Dreissena polymorpha]|uniref:Disease resistance R13L4/SHOC-2-like LRR domain-containing protein n=1 Tax=Dreissena polymorpha TaxID=45954 RepID=A0A9D4RZY1_DREPO|nr:hypothetical protein DPMN_009309 [Dreissena polymorpha]
MANAWLEVSQVESENRRELVLNGQEISNRLEERGIDERIFELTLLNYLEISSTKLSIVPDGIGKLSSLTKLVLCNNALEELTPEVGKLTSLKLLNVSNNKLKSVPVEIQNLNELDTLNLSINQLQDIPNLSSLTNLHVINISNNQIESLPDGIFDSSLVHLSQIIASDNNISCVDSTVDALPHLNLLDLTNNKLTEVPSTLSLCPKLKELKLIGNKFTDRRFGKMVQESKTKSVIEYLHNIWKKESKTSDGNSKDKKKRKKGKKTAVETEVVRNQLSVLRITSDSNVVTVTPAVLSVRQYIICCIVRHLDLSSKFKSFITLQVLLLLFIMNKVVH